MRPGITHRTSVREVRRRYPEAAEVFDQYGIMGCGGPEGPDEPLAFFALVHQVDPDQLITELREHIQARSAPTRPRSTPGRPPSPCCPSPWPSAQPWPASPWARPWPSRPPSGWGWTPAGRPPFRPTASCSSWAGWAFSSWEWLCTSCHASRRGRWRWSLCGCPQSSCGPQPSCRASPLPPPPVVRPAAGDRGLATGPGHGPLCGYDRGDPAESAQRGLRLAPAIGAGLALGGKCSRRSGGRCGRLWLGLREGLGRAPAGWR